MSYELVLKLIPNMVKAAKDKKKTKNKETASEVQAEVEVLPAEGDSPTYVAAEIEILPAEDFSIDSQIVEVPETEAEPETGLTRYDPLRAYLKEISKFSSLSREDENALALKFYNEKDREAAYKLISSNLWLVVKIAREYEKAARSVMDLIQEGNMGLMEAVQNFDPHRGVRLPSYAVWWIKAYIIRYVMANWRMVKIGTTQAQRKLFFNLKKEKEKLEREGFYAAPKLLAEKLNVKENEVVEMEQRLGSSDLSVDMPVGGEESDTSLLSLLPSHQPNAEDIYSDKEQKSNIAAGLKDFSATLKEKELIIFRERMLSEEKATLKEIADKLSLSKERVRQIEEKIKSRLKEYFLEKYGDSIASVEFDK